MRLLLVEDEIPLARSLTAALGQQGIVVDHMGTLALAGEAARTETYAVVLLDRKLPDGDGLEFIPELRKLQPGLPIIILSALGSLDHRIAGLDTGADDYLAKPFAIDELLARIRAVLRRPTKLDDPMVFVGDLRFSLAEPAAYVGDDLLLLTRREMLILEVLVRRAGRTVNRNALESAVFGFDDEIASNTLDAHISRLRKKLLPAKVEIHSLRGLGYLLSAAS